MGVEVPSTNELLDFVPVAQYSDHADGRRGGPLHLSALLPAVSAAIGVPIATPVHPDPERCRVALGMPKASSAIVVLVDGMGYWNLAMRLGHAPYLRSLMNESANQRPISTCTPSTTVAAMGTFGTGTCPGLTCMTGYTQRNPDTGALCQLIGFKEAPDPLDLQRQPTVFERLDERGVRVTTVGLPKFADSPLTKAALRGPAYVGDISPSQRALAACRAARSAGLTYLYIRDADKIGHNYGWNSQRWIAAFERIDAQLALVRRNAPKGTLIVVTADHGMIEADPGQRIDIASEPLLSAGVAMVGGEPRAPMLYAETDANADDIASRWRERLGDAALVLTRGEALADGLFGPIDARVPTMLGDVIVAARAQTTIVDSRSQTDKATRLPSVHGSRTMMEMDIPCLIDVA
ncbi:alkaline phosphatase family protein [Bifidobacterium jacchi]|uniref:Nucleotide pyrophosphatase n=1 Tax=Bifidobacterium jacchi TaxID=2490545 RepID=A0A5N5RKB9_9BIFI|nr:alkaline phosphatase family protein [Bifidobacterium jacchi]KAB5607755.1 nucleotide pyrophosphatase [Bifidobacterium jacchi]